MEGANGLKSKTRGRRYLSGRTLTLTQERRLQSIIMPSRVSVRAKAL
jgi:hypothetical protein